MMKFHRRVWPGFCLVWAVALGLAAGAAAQANSTTAASDQNASPTDQQSQGSAGGPTGNTGPIIIPKKQPQAAPPPSPAPTPTPTPPPKPKNPEYSFSVNVPEVSVPVIVETKQGDFIPHLGPQNFRVFEDGVPQPLQKVTMSSDAPMTVVLLVEYRNTDWNILYNNLMAASYFINELQPKDWAALMTYDLRPHIVVDFTHNRSAIMGGLEQLGFPGFSDGALYDALSDVVDRLSGVQGRKAVILISSGLNTFSHLTFSQVEKKLQTVQDISIYSVSIGWQLREWAESNGYMGGMGEITFLQADNEMSYYARVTGGRFYQPRFEGEYPQDFHEIAEAMRHQYVLTYRPTNTKLDGTFRKLKVDVVAADGGPLRVVDQKGKNVKYEVIAKNGYYAKHVVE
jgi:VWFA-related protein